MLLHICDTSYYQNNNSCYAKLRHTLKHWGSCLPPSAFLWFWQSNSPARSLWPAGSFQTRLFGMSHLLPVITSLAVHTSDGSPTAHHDATSIHSSLQGKLGCKPELPSEHCPTRVSWHGRGLTESHVHLGSEAQMVRDSPGCPFHPSVPLRWCSSWDSGPSLSFPLCGVFHPISRVRPQQLCRPTAQHGLRSPSVPLLIQKADILHPDNVPGPVLDYGAQRWTQSTCPSSSQPPLGDKDRELINKYRYI